MNQKEVEKCLIALGVRITKCFKCQRNIFFIRTKDDKIAKVTMELTNHLIDCPERNYFRKKEKKEGSF